MDVSCPTSPIDDDEHFEFVDYTAASHWERFITTVEDILVGWRVTDGQLGIFDDSNLPPLGHKAYTKTVGGIDPFVKREIIVLEDKSYTLSYHYHPIKRWNEFDINNSHSTSSAPSQHFPPPPTTTLFPPNPDPFSPSSEFLPLSLPNTSYDFSSVNLNTIHRWTGLTHILVLTPTDIFSSGSITKSSTIDLSTTKILLSSFAIVFHNTKCKLPVFVPTGQITNLLYAGYMCLFNKDGSKNIDYASEVEIRFNTTYSREIPSHYSHLAGLTDLFTEKMDLNQLPFDQVDEPKLDKMPHLGISVAGLLTYELQNWDDQDWKTFDYDDIQPVSLNNSNGKNVSFEDDFFKEFEGQNGSIFNNGDKKDISYSQTSDEFVSPVVSLTNLPFGPPNDPFVSMSLTAFFPSAPSNTYLDNDVYSEMDAMRASIWLLKCKFHQESNLHGLLSSLIDSAISSWVIDSGIRHPETNNGNRNRELRKIPNRDLPGSFNDYDLFETARYVRQSTGVIVDMDDSDIDNILQALFDVSRKKGSVPYYNSEKIKTLSGISLFSAATLGLHFHHTRTVPYKSFMWNFLEYLLETVSRASNFRSYSLLGSLKIVWNEVLKRIRWHWERNEPIPDISIHNWSDDSNSSSSYRDNNTSSTTDNKNGLSFDKKGNTTIGIDMRYNLVHQKLCMINCCIERLRQSRKNNLTLSTSLNSSKERLLEGNSFESSGSGSIKPNKSVMESKRTSPDNFLVRFFDHITEDDEINIDPSASMVVVRPENSNGTSHTDIVSTTTTTTNGGKYSNHVHSPSLDFESLPQDYDGSSEEDFVDPIDEVPAVPLKIPRSSNSNQFNSRRLSSFSQGRTYSFTPPLFPDQSDPNQNSSLTESYVELDYSASMESNKGFDKEKLTINEYEVRREVNDENEREGHLRPFNGLTLLETGEPLWVPETQEVGFMTEDMLSEQEEIFEKLGTSEDAAKLRAKMQSAHLMSDMQAFKAANPHAILEDFVRWHSPRDWIPNESDPKKGTLSQRMLEEGNLWQELWKSAQRIPAVRQNPLFKYSLEAEKALHYLEHLPVKDLFKMLLPAIFLIAYDTLVSHPVSKNIKQVASGLEKLTKELVKFPWNNIGSEDISYDGVIQLIRQNELLMGKAISLLRKLPKQYSLVEKLLEMPESQVSDGKERESVYELFASGAPLNDSFPQPTTREFVLQTTCLRPTPVPARMYALLNNNGMRIVDMVGKDTIFM
ncbi:844_t:CDS:10 [Scutellospora calospora]|uniref:844_t:CDS:1 n=1 Tax=Scutellospora calospora TaxID=85575 RepID=A0ACA9KB27_9GLOM|nr:844_t:CDS:10 [Scutellospora calospora]